MQPLKDETSTEAYAYSAPNLEVKENENKLSAEDLHAIELPAIKNRIQRILAHPYCFHYNRLAAMIITVNLFSLFFLTNGFTVSIGLEAISNAVFLNLAIAILVRSQYLINIFFRIATSAPVSWPIKIRQHLAKVYHFGGIHVGGALSATAWYAFYVVKSTQAFYVGNLPGGTTALALSVSILALLLIIGTMAMPPIRAKHHNAFEIVLRFGGWTLLGLVWAELLLSGPAPEWKIALLSLVTLSVAAPWLKLRKVAVEITKPSNHVALSKFDYGETPFAGSSTSISRSPLLEWHAFANVPSPNESGFRLTISRAGDWTGRLIDDKPSQVWVKGITTAGVANIEVLFKRVVYLATGSGIGPCLPHLLEGKVPSLLVWSTRDPRKTYGDELVDEILESQPNAIIWDTSKQGKPDMVKLAYHALKEFDAEAVICISNKKLTFKVKHELESRGIPAYGAIWDS